jgi:hypothetical protein
MIAKALPPSPSTTLVILLGASEWPAFPEFSPSVAFTHAASRLEAYFLDPQHFGLPLDNLLDLFDSEKSADEQDEQIGKFLESRIGALRKAGIPARDVLLYFVGHGGFVGHESRFYLAIRRTRMDNPRASGLQVTALAYTLLEKARHLRRYILLDCCFAAAAFRSFQANPAQVAIEKTVDVFEVKQKREGSPQKGTTLLCSSDHRTPSLLLPDERSTMFSYAVLDALLTGDVYRPESLSLRDLRDLAADRLNDLPTGNAPRPVLHSPDQSQGDVADVPFFPNPAVDKAEEGLERSAELEKDGHPSSSRPIAWFSMPRSVISHSWHLILISLTLLLIIGSSVFFVAPAVLNYLANVRTTTNTKLRMSATISTTVNAATATASIIAANPNPYPPGGGRLMLYAPLKSNINGTWEENSNCTFKNDGYHVNQRPVGWFTYCATRFSNFSNFAFEAQMKIITGNGGGIILHADTTFSKYSAYTLFILLDGRYYLNLYVNGRYTKTLVSSFSSAISQGLNQMNLIAVVAKGSTISVYVNHQQIASVNDSTYSQGQIGFIADAITTPADAVYTNARVWTL